MAKLIAVAIRDSAVGAFNRPFFVPSEGLAMRSFIDEVNHAESSMHKHASDFALYRVGYFEEESGEFTHQLPVLICQADSVLQV